MLSSILLFAVLFIPTQGYKEPGVCPRRLRAQGGAKGATHQRANSHTTDHLEMPVNLQHVLRLGKKTENPEETFCHTKRTFKLNSGFDSLTLKVRGKHTNH